MRIRMTKDASVCEKPDSYARRLVEQGKAVPCRENSAKAGRRAEAKDGKADGAV
ncbi:MAG: hypothetical protein ACI4PG_06550 [Candidatus Ventricola sp.]